MFLIGAPSKYSVQNSRPHKVSNNCFQVTTLASAPARLYVYLADIMRSGTKLSSIRTINVGGTVLTETFARRILAAFDGVRSLRNHYGMSESCGVLCSPPKDEISSGNVGFPAPMVELKVRITAGSLNASNMFIYCTLSLEEFTANT